MWLGQEWDRGCWQEANLHHPLSWYLVGEDVAVSIISEMELGIGVTVGGGEGSGDVVGLECP